MTSNPGRIQIVSDLEDPANSTYLINRNDNACNLTGTVDPFLQQGNSLVVRGGSNQLTVSPGSLSFNATVGGSNPASQSLNIGSTNGPLNYTINSSGGASWLSLTPGSGTTPGTASVSVNINGLAAGTYSATITATSANGSQATAQVALTLTGGSQLTVNPSQFLFSAVPGGPNPPGQTLNIGSTAGTLNWSVSANTSRINFSKTSGTTPGTTTVSIDSSGLSANTFSQYAITISAPNAQSLTVQVGLTITSGGGTAAIAVNPSSLTFNAVQGGASPSAQSINISSTGSALSWTASSNAPWLSVTPASGMTTSVPPPSTATIAVTNTNMSPGTYNGIVTVIGGNGTSAAVQVQLMLTASQPGGSDLLTNGGFESGTAPWTFSGQASYKLNDGNAHSGTSYALLHPLSSTTSILTQRFSIPITATSPPKLTFYLKISTTLNTTGKYDTLYFEIANTSGVTQQMLGSFSNLNAGSGYVLVGPFDLSNMQGQSLILRFRSTTGVNYGGGTDFRIDDVSIK